MLFFLFAAHALMDYPLQGEATANCKCPKSTSPLQKQVPWYYWLTSHAILHGAAVGVVVHWFGYGMEAAVWFAVAEAVIHWFIDLGKCENLYGLLADQLLHLACKVAWWVLLTKTAAASLLTSVSISA